jgi:hypothetical protein
VAQGGAIGLLFDGSFRNAEDAAVHLQVTATDGNLVPATWTLAPNGRVLTLNVSPGRYTVELSAELVDASGKKLGQPLRGQVLVK